MTDGELWLYILAAFSTGVGLGWWLFGGAPSAPAVGSASVARDRAARKPPPEPSAPAPDPPEPPREPTPPATDEAEALAKVRAELDAARAEAQEAALRRSEAESAVEAGRQRLGRLQAHLDRTREERATLESEVERSRRTIAKLQAAPPAPEPPAPDLERDAPTDVEPPKSPTPPFALSPTVKLKAPAPAPGPRIAVPPTPKRTPRPRGPVEVLFGPLGGVPLTTSARSIPWELTIRLHDVPDAPRRVSDVQVTLRFDLEDEGVAINGRRRGPLTVSRGGLVTPDHPLHVQVSLSTGYHSDTAEADRPPAVPGDHPVVIAVQYVSDRGNGTPASVRFSARIPVTAPKR